MPSDPPTDSVPPQACRLSQAIGPGVLFAGAAIGVSHLVQSTSAGAAYGLSLIPLVLLAHASKYPSLLFGPRYAIATGESLPMAYRRQGWHAIGLFGLVLLGTMFTILAAVTIVTAAIVSTHVVTPVLGLMGVETAPPLVLVSAGLIAICAGILAAGGFGWLDWALKGLMVVMLITTLIAAGLNLPKLAGVETRLWPVQAEITDAAWLALVVGLVGWMPAPLDISSWHSLWTLERIRQTGATPSRRQCELDFQIGYALCVVLALAFVSLGAGLLFANGIEAEKSSGAFANQLVSLYTDSLGDWARPLIVACAVAVMFSTTLTVFDGLNRTAAATWVAASGGTPSAGGRGRRYWVAGIVISAGALGLIQWFSQGEAFKKLVDLATTLSFVATPIIAWFNHRAMLAPGVPESARPGRGLRAWSWIGIAFWAAFAVVFLVQRFASSR
ncbi:MAG: divalent metal cation transporter [Planctomycetota bacterium]